MAVQVGSIVEGKVVRLLPYGMLVELPEGETGLVHISEIDNSFVRDVRDYFQENDVVEVKVLGTNDKGRLELSVRQAANERAGLTGDQVPRRRISREEQAGFEEKLSAFLKQSNERQLDVKRNIEAKRGGRRR